MKRLRASLQLKIFAAHVLVIAVGMVTLLWAIGLLAPTFFDRHVAQMMGPGARPLDGMDGMGAMMAGVDLELAQAFREALASAMLLAGGGAVVAAVIASYFVSDRIARPVHHLAVASRRVAAGQYAERVPVESTDELGELAVSFNEMAQALEVTERRRLELVGDVAHELRTPLATLGGYLEGLLDGVVEPTPETLAKLHDETARLRRLVDDLQEVSRAEARQIHLRPAVVRPGDLVEAAIGPLRDAFAEKGLTLLVDALADLPAVRADRDRAIQILTNLLANALRYTPAGGTVQIEVRRALAGVEFRVVDTGIGIAPEHLPHVFERFYRADKARSRAAGGSGIGLTIARALVDAMGGQIRAESPGLGQGARFSFTLPFAS
ncbi:MAG: HAMP domain-containing protein [Chloroflexi bacterium]|nr:HAMP domain-containing protein [Chloroflexota bacterium]